MEQCVPKRACRKGVWEGGVTPPPPPPFPALHVSHLIFGYFSQDDTTIILDLDVSSYIQPMEARKFGLWLFVSNLSFTVFRIRIRDPVPFWPLDPGSGMGKKSRSRSGIRIQDEHPVSYFRVLREKLLGVDVDLDFFDLGSGIRDLKIRNRYPG